MEKSWVLGRTARESWLGTREEVAFAGTVGGSLFKSEVTGNGGVGI